MRHLILFAVALCLAMPTMAKPALPTASSQVELLLQYCVPAIEDRLDPADHALQKKLPEFSAEQALKFSPDGGRVFAIPSHEGNAVLITNRDYTGVCGIALRETDPPTLWDSLHASFNKNDGYRINREKRLDAEKVTKKNFHKNTDKGEVTLLVTVSDTPRSGGMQALMTLARVVGGQ